MEEYRIGIDYSINSPGITIYNKKKNEYIFYSFYKIDYNKKENNEIRFLKILNDIENINIIRRDYIVSNDEYLKINEAEYLSKLIIKTIKKYLNEKTIVTLEGFSFSSKNSSFEKLISFTTIFKLYLYKHIQRSNLVIVSPATLKKSACGKGHATKEDMFNFFINDKTNTNSLYNYIIKEDIKLKKPLDDLIDSFYLSKYFDDKLHK